MVELVKPEDVLAKMVYAIANPVTGHLVERVHHWPGVESLTAIDHNVPLTATKPVRYARVRREGRAVADPGMPLLLSILVEFRPRQNHLAAIDLRAEIHLGTVVGRQRRQADRDGRGQGGKRRARRFARGPSRGSSSRGLTPLALPIPSLDRCFWRGRGLRAGRVCRCAS